MSWARIDDEAWHHEKFEELQAIGVDGMAAIGLWAMALSLTGEKKSPRLTFPQAIMLCGGDRDLASICFDLLRSSGLLDDGSASGLLPKQGMIHNWLKYRSKNEAKANAGRKGGVKSGESRRSKPEAEGGPCFEANAKQSRTPVPDPEPVPVPEPHTQNGAVSLKKMAENDDLSGADVDELGCQKYGRLGGPNMAKIAQLCPVKVYEMRAALAGWPKKWGGFVDCVLAIRQEMSKPTPPAGKSKGNSKTWRERNPDVGESFANNEESKKRIAEIAAGLAGGKGMPDG